MTSDEVLQKLAPWRKAHTRLAWKPLTVDGDGDGALDAHKFSGTPWLAVGETWPLCPGCKNPFQLFLQLNLSKLPSEIEGRFGQGLLQLFYCVCECDVACGGWEPFSSGQLVRVVDIEGIEPGRVDVPEGQFPPRVITGWEIETDLPSAEEHSLLGLEYDYDFPAKKVRVTWAEANLVLDDLDLDMDVPEMIATALSGDKLGGWPHWIQGVEYPACPRCDTLMEIIFQLDSDDNLPYGFGDAGCGHITQCPQHKDVVAFGWACC